MQVIEDQHFTVALRRMTDDCRFSTEVRRRDGFFDVLPKQHLVRLLLQGKIRHVVGMHEKVRISLMEPHTVTEKCQMVLRNILDSSAVAGDGSVATVGHPKFHVFATILERFEHHQFVVANQRNQTRRGDQFGHHFQHARGFHATIYEIAQCDQGVV